MPYKSDAQRRFFHAAEARGEIKPSTVHEFDEASKGKKLPEHVKKMYEGGLIDHEEYEDFKARYQLQDGEEHKADQEHPDFSEDSGSRHEPHHESDLPSPGHSHMSQEVGEEYTPTESSEGDLISREEFVNAVKRDKRRRQFNRG
jgi:hypothetical protein